MCLKKYYLPLVLLLLLSPLLFSEVKLTDSDYQKIKTALTESEAVLQTQAQSIARLEAELKQLKTLQEISEKIISQQSIAFAQHEKYLKEQRKQQTITRILDHLRGFVGGYFVNEYQSNEAK